MSKALFGAFLTLSLSLGASASSFAESAHEHGSSAALQELMLNNGQKWETDDALREGMAAIREALEKNLPHVHHGDMTPAAFAALATGIEQNVDIIIANCKLPEAADEQLHLILTHLLEGGREMEEEGKQTDGVVSAAKALNSYGEYFEHQGWRPLPL
ncbi:MULTISPECIES: hypothetical protein [unclassified Brucella]|uniref:hypothetical protein n=1 Tax=unclassified Brucella TaxID=2632610 RepID=UPI0012958E00|nr:MULTISPECIES: hypothetical protein [unclassified Brucella]MRN78560.1 hypothetical protein [Brucella sp. 10RB9210]QGA57281.1 hypothetical protein GHC20_09435 [Brucella sp. 2280]